MSRVEYLIRYTHQQEHFVHQYRFIFRIVHLLVFYTFIKKIIFIHIYIPTVIYTKTFITVTLIFIININSFLFHILLTRDDQQYKHFHLNLRTIQIFLFSSKATYTNIIYIDIYIQQKKMFSSENFYVYFNFSVDAADVIPQDKIFLYYFSLVLLKLYLHIS